MAPAAYKEEQGAPLGWSCLPRIARTFSPLGSPASPKEHGLSKAELWAKVRSLERQVRELEGSLDGSHFGRSSSGTKVSRLNTRSKVMNERDGTTPLDAVVQAGRKASGGAGSVPHCGSPAGLHEYHTKKGVFVRQGSSKKLDKDLLNDFFENMSPLGGVLASCSTQVRKWKRKNFTSSADLVGHLPLPRLTLAALQQQMGESATPLSLKVLRHDMPKGCKKQIEICRRTGEDLTRAMGDFLESVGGGQLEMVWASRGGLDWWSVDSIEQLVAFYAKHEKKVVNEWNKALIECVFQEEDIQPHRNLYYKYGDNRDIFEEASMHFWQTTPVLVEIDRQIYFGIIGENDAQIKYRDEMLHAVLRAHTSLRYTETAIVSFTPCGVILQQNPASIKYFGLAASESALVCDFNEDGRPVNRLRSLFDSDERYEKMWDKLRSGGIWSCRKLRISASGFKPNSLGKDLPSMDYMAANSSRHFWLQTYLVRDPADGNQMVVLALKDIEKEVRQDMVVKESKKREHELLKSIMPEHIIRFLVEEQKAKEARERDPLNHSLSSSGSSTEDYLGLSALRDASSLREHSIRRVELLAEQQDNVTVLFADIAGFTKMTAESTPAEMMGMLNTLFTLFDDLSVAHGVYKVETIGDAYMCVTGLNLASDNEELSAVKTRCNKNGDCPIRYAKSMLSFAKDILEVASSVQTPQGEPVQIRIGMHSGDCMTGVVGIKMPRFCLFGDTVNTASRMESTGRVGLVHASPQTRELLPTERWISSGGVEVKGKGVMETFLLSP